MGHVETRRHQRVIGAVTDITARTYLVVLATERARPVSELESIVRWKLMKQ